MGILVRKDFSGGWWPSSDAINAPPNVLLRMDNCVLDEQGIVALRLGSSKVNSVALASTDVHSLYSTLRAGSKVRYAGAVNSVFTGSIYGTDLAVTMAGTATDNVSFGAWLGQVFFARSTSKHKHDGTTVRTWGIAPPSAPTVSAQSASTTVVATFNSAESPAFAAAEGTITATFPTGEDGTANGALELTPAVTTGRGTITKIFGSDQDFSTIGGTAESPSDLFDLANYFGEPAAVQKVTVSFAFGSDAADYFRGGSYEFAFQLGGTNQSTNVIGRAMVDAAVRQIERMAATAPPIPGTVAPSTANKRSREEVIERLQAREDTFVYRERFAAATADLNWTHLLCTRSQFRKIGASNNRGWSTIRAFRIIYEATAGSTAVVRFDNATLRGQAEDGMRIGDYKARAAFEYTDGATVPYIERSGASAESATLSLYGQKLRVTLAAPGGNWNTLDTQINKVIVYIMGGVLDQYYEYSVKTTVPAGAGSLDIDIGDTDVDLMIANVPLQLDNSRPPDNIIAIEGPHHNRLFVLDSTGLLHYSHRRRPGEFMTAHALRVGDGNETPYWLKRTNRGIYAGTSRDIYEIAGDGAELADGTIDFTIEGLSVASPPVDACVAAEGNTIVYRAADGKRILAGSESLPVPRSQVDLLWRGYTRHGVSPLNTTTGRFRAAIKAGVLTFIAPEGASTTSSATLHRADFPRNQWYRFTYPSAWRALFVEPDGTLLGSDTSGFVRTLDTGTADAGTGLAVETWTKSDDDGRPSNKKLTLDQYWHLDTGGTVGSYAIHYDGSASANSSGSLSATGPAFFKHEITSVVLPRSIQFRVSGTFTTFRYYGHRMAYRLLPESRIWTQTPWLFSPSGDVSFLREVRVMMLGQDSTTSTMTITSDIGGAFGGSILLNSNASTVVSVYTVRFGREVKARAVNIVVKAATFAGSSADVDNSIFWIEPRWDDAGNVTEKKRQRYYPDQIDAEGME